MRNQGKWNNHEVAIKLLDRDTVSVNLQLRLDIKAMRDIRHKNLAAFVGACCTAPNVCILMELGPKGSLDDLLSSDSLNLDWNFKFALLKVCIINTQLTLFDDHLLQDICRGMNYLATTPIKSHGRLKASNCVVDNRWTLKITGNTNLPNNSSLYTHLSLTRLWDAAVQGRATWSAKVQSSAGQTGRC